MENYHIQIQNSNKSNLNRRDELLKNDNTDNKKPSFEYPTWLWCITKKFFTEIKHWNCPWFNHKNGITPFELSSKCKHRFRIKPYGGAIAIYEDFVDHICPTLRRKPYVIAIHIGTNDITDYDFSSLQINLSKTPDLVTELSPSTKIVLSSIILRYDKSNINVKKLGEKK